VFCKRRYAELQLMLLVTANREPDIMPSQSTQAVGVYRSYATSTGFDALFTRTPDPIITIALERPTLVEGVLKKVQAPLSAISGKLHHQSKDARRLRRDPLPNRIH
jgi:hypothetical protein